MIDTNAKPGPYLRLMALIALMGVLSAVVTFVFMFLVYSSIALVWEEIPSSTGVDPRLFIFAICILGGLLVGLSVKYFGDHNAIFAELMRELGRTGRFDYRHAPVIVIMVFVFLVAGASLGPEAPLADASGAGYLAFRQA